MGYLCVDCSKEFNRMTINRKDFDNNERSLCPICGGSLVYIDDLILPVVQILNEKGYKTAYCCSGHVDFQVDSVGYLKDKTEIPVKVDNPPNTYIAFQTKYTPKIIPNDFHLESEILGSTCIRKRYDEYKDNHTIQREILETMLELLNWAESLNSLK